MILRRVAIIDFSAESEARISLEQELRAGGWDVIVCGAPSRRERLRWILDIDPAQGQICVLIDPVGAEAGAALQGLDPAVPAVIWMPSGGKDAIAGVGGATALISVAASAKELSEILAVWVPAAGAGAAVQDIREGTEPEPVSVRKSDENSPPEAAPAGSGGDDRYDAEHWQDLQMLRELEQSMALARAGGVPADRAPVPVLPAALDFSVPLRALMTAAGKVAEQAGSAEVTGAYAVLALLSEGGLYGRALAGAGLDDVSLKEAAAAARVGELPEKSEPVMSQEVFDAVGRGKEIARTVYAPVVRVYDFLLALLEGPSPSVERLLESRGADPARVLEAIITAGPEQEAAPDPFFRPSSLDQAGFYEFDDNQLEGFVNRLKDRPSFRKAARRVPETRSRERDEAAARMVPISPASVPKTAPEPPEKPEVLRVSGEFPSVDEVEQAADLLLEGHLVAFPSDTMMALAADATNPGAVEALRRAAGVPEGKPLGLWINSTAQLKHLVRADLDALEPLLDSAWPGALTLVFDATAAVGAQVQKEGSIALRQPTDSLSLALLSMLGRPLAVTSWDGDASGLTGKVAAVFDHGSAAPSVVTTVVDVRTIPWKILREGAVAPEALRPHEPPVPED